MEKKTSDFPRQQSVEKAVFFTNGWRAFFTLDLFPHFGYCSPKIGVSLQKGKQNGIAAIQNQRARGSLREYTLETN